jgi:hypothetical protein
MPMKRVSVLVHFTPSELGAGAEDCMIAGAAYFGAAGKIATFDHLVKFIIALPPFP